MTHELLAVINELIAQQLAAQARPVYGEIESVNADGSVIVVLKPGDAKLGPIQYLTPWAGSPGSASGFHAPPKKGTLVKCQPTDADGQHWTCQASVYSGKNTPPTDVEQGEMAMVHEDGSCVKLRNSGNTLLSGSAAVRAVAPTVDITDTDEALTDNDALVRKSDLQAVVTQVNVMWAALKAPGAFTTLVFGGPVPSVAATVAAVPDVSAATASSVGKAKG